MNEAKGRLDIRYRIIAEYAYDWEFWCNPQGRYLYCSPSCERITGHPAEEFLSNARLRASLIHPEDGGRFKKHVREVEKRRIPGEAEWRVLRPDGSWRWIAHVCRPIFDPEGKYLGCRGSDRDITGPKQTEAALIRERNVLGSIMKSTDVMLAMLDLKFYFLWVNDAYACSGRMKPEDMVGRNHFTLYPHKENEAIFRMVRDTGEGVFYKDRPFMFRDQPERGMTYWDWSLLPVKDASGKVLSLILSLRETTKFVCSQRALAMSKNRFRALVTATSDVVYRMASDWREMRQLVGKGLLANTSASNANWLQERIFPEDRALLMAAIRKAIRTKKIFELEHRVRLATGGEGWVFSRAIPVMDAQGKIVEWLGMASEITERKKAEEVLRRDKENLERLVSERTRSMIESQKKLTAAKRLSDIGALAAVVAHELRTPLSVIRVAAYNLRRKSSNGHLVEHIARIEKKVFEANQIIDNLLFYSRIKTPVFKKVNVRSLLEECVAEAKVRFSGEPVRIVKEWKSTKHFFAKADPLQIKEVFHNLLTNAVEALPIRGGGDRDRHGF